MCGSRGLHVATVFVGGCVLLSDLRRVLQVWDIDFVAAALV